MNVEYLENFNLISILISPFNNVERPDKLGPGTIVLVVPNQCDPSPEVRVVWVGTVPGEQPVRRLS